MSKQSKPTSKLSFRLEEPIPVPLYVVGTPEWIENSLSDDAKARYAKQIIPVKSAANLEPVKKHLRKYKYHLVDTETSGPRKDDGLDPLSPSSHLVLFQIGSKDMGFAIEPKLAPEFRFSLESEDYLKVLQHAVHDYRFLLHKYGIVMNRMFCTMLAEQVLSAGRDGIAVGLADLVRRYAPHRIIQKGVRDEFIQHSGVITANQLYYAVRDIILLQPVFDAQVISLKQANMLWTGRVEFDNIPITGEMKLTGVLIDKEKLQDTINYHTRKRKDREDKIFTLYNETLSKLGRLKKNLFGEVTETFNLSSPIEKLRAFERLGIELEDTETDTLKLVDHPMAKLMVEWSGSNKILTTYGETLLERIHYHTGRLHPNFDQLGAGEHANRGGKSRTESIATGRYSGDFQQLPKPEEETEPISPEEEAMVRSAFADKIKELEDQLPKAA